MTRHQRAVGITAYGGPEVLAVVDRPVPLPGPGQVRVAVACSPVTPTDRMLRSGAQAAALAGLPFPYTPGMECAGVVDALGVDVVGWRVGDRVAALVDMRTPQGGTQSEYVVVDVRSIAAVPGRLPLEQAACLPMSALTAAQALDAVRVPGVRTVRISGTSGVVGGYAVRLLEEHGLQPIDEGSADAVIDAAGLGAEAWSWVRDGGVLVTVRPGGPPDGRIRTTMVSALRYRHHTQWLQRLVDLAAAGRLGTRIVGRFPYDACVEAHRTAERRGLGGRVLLLPT